MSGMPTKILTWCAGRADRKTEPTEALQATGYGESEQPEANHFNFMFANLYEWAAYFKTVITDNSLRDPEVAYIGGESGTHADLNDLCTDINDNGASYRKAFIENPFAVSETQVVDVDDLIIEFSPKAYVTDADAAQTAIELKGSRITLQGARFTYFNKVGDVAVKIHADAKFCTVKECLFYNCNDPYLDDQGLKSRTYQNLLEVE